MKYRCHCAQQRSPNDVTGNVLSARDNLPLLGRIFFFFINIFYYYFFFTHNIQNITKKQQTYTQYLKVQSKGRERGKDNKNTKQVTPLYNQVYQKENTAKHQWSKAWPHRLAPLYIHTSLFAGGYGSNMFFYTCGVNQFCIIAGKNLHFN